MREPNPAESPLDTAVDRAREAEERFLREPVGTPRSVEEAHHVEQRAEEVEELATEVAESDRIDVDPDV